MNEYLEKLQKEQTEKMTLMKQQLNDAVQKEKKNAEKNRALENKISNLNIELSTVQLKSKQEFEEKKKARMKQLALEDSDFAMNESGKLRSSMLLAVNRKSETTTRLSQVGEQPQSQFSIVQQIV